MKGRFCVNTEEIRSTARINDTPLAKIADKMLGSTVSEPHRAPELRPSSMPMCSIRVLRDLILGKKNVLKMDSDFYMRIGTIVHTVIQTWLPRLGVGFGNWVCPKKECGKRNLMTTNRICVCGNKMCYEEIEVEFKGVTGHIDYVIEEANGKRIVDFKTASDKKITLLKTTKDPVERNKVLKELASIKYIMQLLTYTYIAQKLYGWDMVGSSLLFISRNDPKNYVEVSFVWTDHFYSIINEFVHDQIRGFNAAHKSAKTLDPTYAVNNRCCKNSKHYWNEVRDIFFHGCDLYPVCVGTNSLKNVKAYLEKEIAFLR